MTQEEDNGHNRKTFEKIANTYIPPDKNKKQQQPNLFAILPFYNADIEGECSTNNNSNNIGNNSNTNNNSSTNNTENNNNNTSNNNTSGNNNIISNSNPTNNNSNNNNEEENIQLRPNAKIPFIPGGVSYKLRRALNRAGCNTHVTAGTKLQNLLCSSNKTHPDPMEKSGIYKYQCPEHKVEYIGETKRSFKTRDKEHRKAAETGKWSHSGLTQHMRDCNATIPEPHILHNTNDKSKNPKFDLRVREALYIRRYKCGPGKGMNEDLGSYVTTTQWEPVFNRIR